MGSVITFCLDKALLTELEAKRPDGDLIRICIEPDHVASVVRELETNKDSLELVILGSKFTEPVQMAQRIHAMDKTISIIALAAPEELDRLKRTFQFALLIGDQVCCVADDDVEGVMRMVSECIARTRSKRIHSQVLRQFNASLTATSPGTPASAVHLDKLLDYAPIGIAIISAGGNILAWNRKAREITGLNERDVVSQQFESLFSLAGESSPREFYELAQHSLAAVTLEGKRNLSEAPVRHFEFTLGRLGERGDRNLMIAFHEITARKNSEMELLAARDQAQAANEAKSRFLANISHEIRTPIGAMLGFIELMKQPGASPADIQKFISTIDRNGHQLLRLIDDILDLAKIEAGRLTVLKARFPLMELLADINSVMGFRAREKGLEFKVNFDGDLPEVIESDEVRIRQVLSNLLGNAIKFTARGKVELTARCDRTGLTFTIEDTGIGLSLAQSERLFSPFMQADATVTRRFGGSGLGLAISRKLAELLGGGVRLLESQPGKGSTFEFKLHTTIPSEAEWLGIDSLSAVRSEGSAEPHERKSQLSGMRILVVEDSADNRFLIAHFLQGEGAAVDFAEDGSEGVTKATGQAFDVVVMDMQMPVCDGLEATRRLRAQGYDRPIIALTAHAMEEERRRAFTAGCTDYLTKPIERKKLISVLARYR